MTTEENLIKKENLTPSIEILRLYSKDVSYEAPDVPDVFQGEWNPAVNFDMGVSSKELKEKNHYEVIISVTVTTNAQQGDKTIFLAEVHYAGIFFVGDFPVDQKNHILGAYCPSILFPYARQIISDLVMQGSFPQLVLPPVNFDQIYIQKQQDISNKDNASNEKIILTEK